MKKNIIHSTLFCLLIFVLSCGHDDDMIPLLPCQYIDDCGQLWDSQINCENNSGCGNCLQVSGTDC